MKKTDKKKLSLEKFSISKLNGMSKIFGGNDDKTHGNTTLMGSTRACQDEPEGQ